MKNILKDDYLVNKVLEFLDTVTSRENVYDIFLTGSCVYPEQYVSNNDVDVKAVLYNTEGLKFKYKFQIENITIDVIVVSFSLCEQVINNETTDMSMIFQTSYYLNSLYLKTEPDLDKFLNGETKWKENTRDYIFNHLLDKRNGYYLEYQSVPRAFFHVIIQLEIYKQKTFDIHVLDIIENIKSYKEIQNYEQWLVYCEREMNIIHNH